MVDGTSCISPQVVNVALSKVQRMWLASSRPAKKQATAESGIYKIRLYQSEDQLPRLKEEREHENFELTQR